jgi:MoaA/NifB/PqqE/SkfB family radical SAM enzyme
VRAISVGFACNNACVFCAQGDLRATKKAEDDAVIAAAIAAITEGEVVAFVGGEPTLFESLPTWIRSSDARGARRVIVQTNGRRLAYRAYARALREASAKLALDVSLHGSTAAMHEWHTSVEQSFSQTVQGIRNARAEGIAVGVTTVVTRSNYRHLTEIVRVARAAGAGAIHFTSAQPFGRAARGAPPVVPVPELVAPYRERAIAEAVRLGMRIRTADRVEADVVDLFAGLGEVEGRS